MLAFDGPRVLNELAGNPSGGPPFKESWKLSVQPNLIQWSCASLTMSGW
jgi:hypothetical protein